MKLALLLLACPAALAQVALTQAVTPSGERFLLAGEKPPAPAPTVFFLGGEMRDSLTQQRYIDAQVALGRDVLKVSLDLPGHGADHRATDTATSLAAWRTRMDKGEDLVTSFTRRATAVLDHLIAERYTDPKRVAAFGTSRGGFMALHFAAADPRVRDVAAFAPVTDLLALREFHEMNPDHLARAANASRLADPLDDRGIWVVIGSTDHRVATRSAIAFVERVVESAEARGRRPAIELHLLPANGHTIPDSSYPQAARWLLARWK